MSLQRAIQWVKGLFGWKSARPRLDYGRLHAPGDRLTKEEWVKLVDLPGYADWAADYDRLERIIPDLAEYHLLVHPEHVKQPPDGFFEGVFQSALDNLHEHFGHYNLPRHSLQDYRWGGKFSKLHSPADSPDESSGRAAS